MEYKFKLELYTEGDFSFPYVPEGMDCDSSPDYYVLRKEFDSRDKALEYIKTATDFLREHVTGDSDAIKAFNTMINDFFIVTKHYPELNYVSKNMKYCGLYSESCIELRREMNNFRVDVLLTDDELKEIKSASLSLGDVKEALLAKAKENKEKYGKYILDK